MSQVITNAFENYWQSCLTAEQPVVLDEFILADIPNLDITSPIDPDAGLPPESQIVHRQNVDQRGRINNNAVAYTIVMDTTVGDFSFNAMYLRNKANGVIGMIVYKGRETKLKTDQTTGQTGNSLVKSMLMGYDQAAEATLTHVDAGTWQIDYAARLRGMDEDIRQLQADLYGHHTFVGDGFKVVEKDGAYQVSQGVAIVGGLRVELKAPEVIHPGSQPIGVWVDVHRAGSLLSEHQNHFTIITSVADLTDHVDSNGYQHYVAKLATVLADGTIEDGRRHGYGGGLDSSMIKDSVDGDVANALANARVINIEALRRSYDDIGMTVTDWFAVGSRVNNAAEVLIDKATGKGYSYSGGYPHTVEEGETPASHGWSDRSSNTLKDVLKSISGVSYRQYGAKLNGIDDDTDAILRCHADANEHGYKIVQSGGIAKINGTKQIVWKVDAEYSNGFHFLCDTIMDSLFLFASEYNPINLTLGQVNIAEFTKYAMNIPSLAAYKNYAVFLTDTKATDLMRVGGLAMGKRCMTVVNRNGDLRYPLTTTFASLDKCMLTPINVPLRTVSGFAIKYTGSNEKRLPVKVTRNKVKFIEPTYKDASSADIPIGSFISLEFVYDFEVVAGGGDPIGADRVADSYFINYWTSGKIKISGLSYDVGWAGTDGNYTRDVIHENCQADRLGGHYSCWDFTFNNITTSRSRAIDISGGGKLSINNLKIMVNSSYSPFTAVEIRGDYAAEWDGDIDIDGVTVDAQSITDLSANPVVNILSGITDSSVGNHDFGRKTALARSIKINDVEVLVNPIATGGRILVRGAVVGCVTGIANQVAYPDKIEVSNVNIIDGSAPVGNAVNAVTIFGEKKPAWRKQYVRVLVDACSNKDPRAYGGSIATIGDDTISITGNTNTNFKLEVSRCDWLRYSVMTNGSGSSEATIVSSRLAYIKGNSSDEIFLGDCRISNTRLDGSFLMAISGGILEAYLNNDGVTYGQFGYPNNPEVNLKYAKGMAIEPNSSIRGSLVTKDLLQAGYYQSSYYAPFVEHMKGQLSPIGNVTPRWVGDEYLDQTEGQYKWYKSTGLTNNDWKPAT